MDLSDLTEYEDPRRTQTPEYPEDKVPEKDPDADFNNFNELEP